ncbi:MAG: DUF488 domain-containing protein [Candidatus Saccharimonadales bacterium]
MANLTIKRVYEPAEASDGYRVLVDRLWPRGVSKDKAKVDVWLKEVGPSTELRKWFNHEPPKYPEFKNRYEKELKASTAFSGLQKLVKDHSPITLVYSAHDAEHNQAVVLLGLLTK